MNETGMFQTAELGHRVSAADFKTRTEVLREELLQEQRLLTQQRDFAVLALFAGVDGAGKGDTVNLLNAWMDPRWLRCHAYGPASDEEYERPTFWKYWRDLPPRGALGLFMSAWYSAPLLQRVYRKISLAEFDEQLDQIVNFERTLTDDGALIIKYWMHLSHKAQKKRLRTLSKDPLHGWRVNKRDWQHWKLYDRFIIAAERLIMRTSTGAARWHIIEGQDPAYRSLATGTLLRDAIRQRRTAVAGNTVDTPAVEPATDTQITLLDHLKLDKRLSKRRYNRRLLRYQGQLHRLQRKAVAAGLSTVLVFEGADAAGKGGAIRRLVSALDIRHVRVTPIAAPTEEERAQHYLWRFWRQLSRAGQITIFDRSWYGRVLVERVEQFATPQQWRRAYAEINAFESQLSEAGILVLKFWLHIGQDEQAARFEARQQSPHKRWKLTEEDWRNRDRNNDYRLATHEMFEQTGTHIAPWILVEANDKRYARIKVLRMVCKHLRLHLRKN